MIEGGVRPAPVETTERDGITRDRTHLDRAALGPSGTGLRRFPPLSARYETPLPPGSVNSVLDLNNPIVMVLPGGVLIPRFVVDPSAAFP